MIDRLICPDCKKGLSREKDSIHCRACRREFPVIEGIPVILPRELTDFKQTEIDFYTKHFGSGASNFGFVETDWDKNTYGLLDFMEDIETRPKDAKILELGAGNGQYSMILRKKGFKNITVSDISANGLIAARKYLDEKWKDDPAKGKELLLSFDWENIPFATDTFDILFSAASLHHLPHPEKGIAEMNRCVKPGGLIVVAIEPNAWPYYIIRPVARLLKIRLIDKSKDSFSIADESTHGFSMRKLKKYFRSHNIKILKTRRVWFLTGLLYYFPELVKRLFNKTITIPPGLRLFALKLDRLIGKLPLLRTLSFHNTIIGTKQ